MKYDLYFFKENNRNFQIEAFFEFLTSNNFSLLDDHKTQDVILTYQHPVLQMDVTFHFTRTSRVPDLHRLNPKYFDLNFHLSLDPMMPMYKANLVFDFIKTITIQFKLCIYHVLFENVAPFQLDLLDSSYRLYRKHYKQNNQVEYASLVAIEERRLNDVLRYACDRAKLEAYYQPMNVTFPKQRLLRSTLTSELMFAIDFPVSESIVFPPRTDLVFCHFGDTLEIIKYDAFIAAIQKQVVDLPGFIAGTKMIPAKQMKKARKIISKEKFKEIKNNYEIVDTESLIDI